jgi:hypothetical protein
VNGTLVRILSLAWNKVGKFYAKSEQLILEIIGATMTPEFHRLNIMECFKRNTIVRETGYSEKSFNK